MRPSPENNDDVLMRRFQRDCDGKAFEELVCAHATKALAVARQTLTDGALAEDAVQEAFLRVVRCRAQYLAGRSFGVWFYAIVRNVCLDMIRRRRRESTAMAILARELSESTRDDLQTGPPSLLEHLGPAEQAVLRLRVIHDLSFPEIASALGISEEAAKKRAQRGLKRLRERAGVAGRLESWNVGIME